MAEPNEPKQDRLLNEPRNGTPRSEQPAQDRISPLRRPGVVPVLAAEVVSITGSQVSALALPWFVLATSHSTTRMGIVAAAEMLAMALFAVPGGAIMTALLSASLFAGSLGTLTAGQILHAGFATGFLIAAAAQTFFGAVFLYGTFTHTSPAPQ